MALRCLLFSTDEATAQSISPVLTGLGVETDHISAAMEAVEKVSSESFQFVIVDWDNQPEAGFLLRTARERKPSDRPLTLAIVSDDASVQKALQGGANSTLRKPLQVNQVQDTLATARDLLRSKSEVSASPAAPPPRISSLPSSHESDPERPLRAGEFLQSGTVPGAHFDVASEVQISLDQAAGAEIDPLSDLEPTAAAVQPGATQAPKADAVPARKPVENAPAVSGEEPRGLEWYLKARAGKQPAIPKSALTDAGEDSTNAAHGQGSTGNELIGFEQNPSPSLTSSLAVGMDAAGSDSTEQPGGRARHGAPRPHPDQKTEAALFAYMEAGTGTGLPEETPLRRSFSRAASFIAALILICGIGAIMPQAPWHRNAQAAWNRALRGVHGWLNPQTVSPPQAPASHENFGQAGDEYKLPVAESIPDATTDPTQIRVLAVVDPTAKQPPNSTPGQNAAPAAGDQSSDAAGVTPVAGQNSGNSNPSVVDVGAQPQSPNESALTPASPTAASAQPQPSLKNASRIPDADAPAAHPAPPQPHYVAVPGTAMNRTIPLSMKSQMASMTPDPGGNKPVEAALPSIEPVNLPEATARGLLLEQPAPAYPNAANGHPGTVILQVLIGRDGTVQDAKFLQGSLSFARAATEAVKQWRFSPYLMNNRAASVQTLLTINFKPAS